ncbi:MAG: hypothetical protein ACK5YL_00165 [Holosporales bacterium]|jgi:hypothetical protein
MSKVQNVIGLSFATAALMYVGGCNSNLDTPAPSPEPTPSVSVIPSPKPTPLTCIISEETGEKWIRIAEESATRYNSLSSKEKQSFTSQAYLTLKDGGKALIVPYYPRSTTKFAVVLESRNGEKTIVDFGTNETQTFVTQPLQGMPKPNPHDFQALCMELKNLKSMQR